ncbi:hypothetical protein [Terriglobus sp. 2YAB30_2]|uniref:hypothetical protein n=1 Tax=Terriglobus sp. 2YAB30_2 TaxID=3233023 RepID=UPI003F9CDDE5
MNSSAPIPSNDNQANPEGKLEWSTPQIGERDLASADSASSGSFNPDGTTVYS